MPVIDNSDSAWAKSCRSTLSENIFLSRTDHYRRRAGSMNSTIQGHYASSLSAASGRSETWQLGQMVRGSVTGDSRVNPTVSIGGNNYRLSSDLQFSQGESLLLRVKELSPRIELSLVSRSRDSGRPSAATTIFLTDKILQASLPTHRSISSSLSSLVGLLQASSASALPPATALLIETMKNRLIKPQGLTIPEHLERSVSSSSLLTGRFTGTPTPNDGLLSLLQQIANALEHESQLAHRLPAGVKYQQALGMSLYLISEMNLLRSLSRVVNEQYARLSLLRNTAQQDLEQQAYHLFAELPVLFKNRIDSVSLRFLKKRPGDRKTAETVDCSVEFEFEFEGGRINARILILGSSASFSVECERPGTAISLEMGKNPLARRLEHYGLRLEEFSVSIQEDSLPCETVSNEAIRCYEKLQPEEAGHAACFRTDEATRVQLRKIVAEGMMPELEEFALRIDRHHVQTCKEIPTYLYCAMACLFAQLFETQKIRDLDF